MNPRLKYKDSTYFSLLKTTSRIYFFEIKIVANVIDLILLFIIYTTSSTPWKNHYKAKPYFSTKRGPKMETWSSPIQKQLTQKKEIMRLLFRKKRVKKTDK